MCQKFLVFLVCLATGALSRAERPASRDGLFVKDPNNYTIIQVENDGSTLGWIDISNTTLISPTGTTGRPITLVNVDKPTARYTLYTGTNASTRKFLFRGKKRIACYKDGKQVHCDDVVRIIFHYPHHNAVYSVRYNSLELA